MCRYEERLAVRHALCNLYVSVGSYNPPLHDPYGIRSASINRNLRRNEISHLNVALNETGTNNLMVFLSRAHPVQRLQADTQNDSAEDDPSPSEIVIRPVCDQRGRLRCDRSSSKVSTEEIVRRTEYDVEEGGEDGDLDTSEDLDDQVKDFFFEIFRNRPIHLDDAVYLTHQLPNGDEVALVDVNGNLALAPFDVNKHNPHKVELPVEALGVDSSVPSARRSTSPIGFLGEISTPPATSAIWWVQKSDKNIAQIRSHPPISSENKDDAHPFWAAHNDSLSPLNKSANGRGDEDLSMSRDENFEAHDGKDDWKHGVQSEITVVRFRSVAGRWLAITMGAVLNNPKRGYDAARPKIEQRTGTVQQGKAGSTGAAVSTRPEIGPPLLAAPSAWEPLARWNLCLVSGSPQASDPVSEWVICKASVPPVPLWTKRISGLLHRPAGIEKTHQELFPHLKTNANGLGRMPVMVQEYLLVEDLIYSFMGVQGEHIEALELPPVAPHPPPQPPFTFPVNIAASFSPFGLTTKGPSAGLPEYHFRIRVPNSNTPGQPGYPPVDPALRQMTTKLLSVCRDVRLVTAFVDRESRMEHGLAQQALCAAIRSLLKEFQVRLAQLETLHRSAQLTLQKLWFFLQPTRVTFDVLRRVAVRGVGKRGGELLNAIHDIAVQLSSTDVARRLCDFLLEKTAAPLCAMLEKWLYEGLLDDPYGDFFCMVDPSVGAEASIPKFDWTGGVGKGTGGGVRRTRPRDGYVGGPGAHRSSSAGRLRRVRREPMHRLRMRSHTLAPLGTLIDRGVCGWWDHDSGSLAGAGESGWSGALRSDAFWARRFRLSDIAVPRFLEQSKDKILHTGKYLSVLMSCRESHNLDLECPVKIRIQYSSNERVYLEAIDRAHLWASTELTRLFVDKLDLRGRLLSIKKFFLFYRADYFYQFLDHAASRLESPNPSLSKLQSLMESATRTASTAYDPFKDDMTCGFHGFSLQELTRYFELAARQAASQNAAAQVLQSRAISSAPFRPATLQTPAALLADDIACASHPAGPSGRIGFEAFRGEEDPIKYFTLRCRPSWPLNLILSGGAMLKYQLLFRIIGQFKFVERRLSEVWQDQQYTKELQPSQFFIKSYLTRHRMIHFCQNFVYFVTHEVIEPQWNEFHDALAFCYTLDDIMAAHDRFLDICLRESLLTESELFRSLSKVLTVCGLFAKHALKFSLYGSSEMRPHFAPSALPKRPGHDLQPDVGTEVPVPLRGRTDLVTTSGTQPRIENFSRALGHAGLALRRARIAASSAHFEALVRDQKFLDMIAKFASNFDRNLQLFLKDLVARR
eukprot:GHVN01096779.1.p1 GENE.GHVN01096779.1~~GHVN01096779.1.p1  ORF type:complete len:1401 (+),score=148.75 GHVN01096779.1:267-4205(+)